MTKKGQQVLSGTTSNAQSANIHHLPAIKPNLSASAPVSSASTLQRSFQRLQQQEMIGFDFINGQKARFVLIYLFIFQDGAAGGGGVGDARARILTNALAFRGNRRLRLRAGPRCLRTSLIYSRGERPVHLIKQHAGTLLPPYRITIRSQSVRPQRGTGGSVKVRTLKNAYNLDLENGLRWSRAF